MVHKTGARSACRVRKLTVLILIVALASSCVTQRRCLQKFPPEVKTDTVFYEVVRDSIVYRDTTIILTLPGQTVIDSIFIKPGVVETSPVVLETALARAEAYYRTPKVYLKLIQKDTTIQVRLDSALRDAYHWKAQYYEILAQTLIKEKYIPEIYKIALWLVIGIAFSFIAYMLVKIFR